MTVTAGPPLVAPAEWLPADATATLIGRVWDPAAEGPSPVIVESSGQVRDLSRTWPTVSALCEDGPSAAEIRRAAGPRISEGPSAAFLAPVDLQVVKAAGVTFVVSMLERLIEERADGDAQSAQKVRSTLSAAVSGGLRNLRPGSADAATLKASLVAEGLWSQYLEVGIGPDAEIFTKAPILSAVGPGSRVGVLSTSEWSNPEPEVALLVSSAGQVMGATLANDVNLRDIEGRSALLLPRAKDNNASCALGPFIRWFDDGYGMNEVRRAIVSLEIRGTDGFLLEDSSDMSLITRDPLDIVGQLIGAHHRYPDGAVLMLGTMFAPVVDREAVGEGFTHRRGDVVRISSQELGSLVNTVDYSEECPPWEFGVGALMRNLESRGLLATR